ncbi:MAG: FKBP-type peptidyl-prolyl cis-trans isomerase [Patescibacteria group bacterium]
MVNEEKLKIETLKKGEGKEATKGDKVLVHYTGKLEDGTEFDSSVKREPISFTLGEGKVIEGWEKGILGMKKGGKRKLVISPELAYGENGIPGTIPGGATLIFEVELVEIN